ncbi:MAG TPA: phage holin family protein, partial [Acidimicrobiales bacterium]|nr:phage holin family protein [Acidimicrobiales bacterium]
QRPTGELLSAISNDLVKLVRQEVELGKLEVSEALGARTLALVFGSVAGVFGLVALVFGALAGSDALAYLLPTWAARLVMAGALGLVMLMALPMAAKRATKPDMRPTETLRTTKEDIEWAKAQLKR